jgi:hypothetical protein
MIFSDTGFPFALPYYIPQEAASLFYFINGPLLDVPLAKPVCLMCEPPLAPLKLTTLAQRAGLALLSRRLKLIALHPANRPSNRSLARNFTCTRIFSLSISGDGTCAPAIRACPAACGLILKVAPNAATAQTPIHADFSMKVVLKLAVIISLLGP